MSSKINKVKRGKKLSRGPDGNNTSSIEYGPMSMYSKGLCLAHSTTTECNRMKRSKTTSKKLKRLRNVLF